MLCRTRSEIYESYADYDLGYLVVFVYNDPAYRDWYAKIMSPITKRSYPLTNMGLQAMAWDEDATLSPS